MLFRWLAVFGMFAIYAILALIGLITLMGIGYGFWLVWR